MKEINILNEMEKILIKLFLILVKYLQPNKNHKIFEVGCGPGTTLNKIQKIFKSKVFGLDTSKKAINFAKTKYKLKNMFNNTFLSFKTFSKFDIVISGGFLYVTPNKIINSTIKKAYKISEKRCFPCYLGL